MYSKSLSGFFRTKIWQVGVICSDVYAVISSIKKMPVSPICQNVCAHFFSFHHLLLLFFPLSLTPLNFSSSSVFSLEFLFPHLSLSLSLLFPLPVSLPLSKHILTCPRTVTKPAFLFILHRGITLFFCYYFFGEVASVCLAPDSATLSHPHYIFTLRYPRTQGYAHTHTHTHTHTLAHTFLKPTHFSLGVLCLCLSWFLGVLE